MVWFNLIWMSNRYFILELVLFRTRPLLAILLSKQFYHFCKRKRNIKICTTKIIKSTWKIVARKFSVDWTVDSVIVVIYLTLPWENETLVLQKEKKEIISFEVTTHFVLLHSYWIRIRTTKNTGSMPQKGN